MPVAKPSRSAHPYRRPSRRPLQIFALDPMRIDRGKHGLVTPRTTLYPPFEDNLRPGPEGKRLRVIDYDGVHRRFYAPIDLNHPDVLIRDGLRPSETDPRFHQQMVYAVVANLWADFETALGRRVTLGRKSTLTIFPHAFYGRNAFYDPASGSLHFGYFRADVLDAGTNLPGQLVFTCLSHDIIVHETTHALVDRLRPDFLLQSNPDVAAFHEGFADLIAVFQHFKIAEVLVPALTDSRGELRSEALLGLARQFGYSTGTGAALRTARAGDPDPAAYRTATEAHQRGAVLVRAVFDAFLSTYEQRTADLVRLASEGTGILREGALHPDLVNRLASEASALANSFFTLLLRAFDYLPPMDVRFEDLLRALVTVDLSLSPSDESLRVAVIEGFRRYGIYPTSAGSLGDEAVALARSADDLSGFPFNDALLADILRDMDDLDPEGFAVEAAPSHYGVPVKQTRSEKRTAKRWSDWAAKLHEFATKHANTLQLDPDLPIAVQGMHPTIRYRANGRSTVDLVVRFKQQRADLKSDPESNVVPSGGCTVVAGVDGRVRYVIAKRLPAVNGPANPALDRHLTLGTLLQQARDTDPGDAYRQRDDKALLSVNFALLHDGGTHG